MTDLNDDNLPARMSSAQSRELGAELRQVRRAAGYRANKLAEELGWSQAKVSKLERGWRGASPWDIATLLGRCGTDKPTRDRIMNLAQEPQVGYYIRAHQRGFPDALLCLEIHEQMAISIAAHDPNFVPELLQTEAYASALLEPFAATPGLLDPMLQRRVDRQAVLCKADAPKAVFYIYEKVLDFKVGTRSVMHDQMKWLTFMCDSGQIAIRIIPMNSENQGMIRSSATLFKFARGLTPLVYMNVDSVAIFADERSMVDFCIQNFVELDSSALTVAQSRDIFEQRAEFYG